MTSSTAASATTRCAASKATTSTPSISATDSVIEIAGEGTDKVLTALVSYTLVAHVERLAGTLAVGQTLRANALDNVVDGSAGGDSIRLQDGGTDKVFGNGGGDILYFGAAMTAADQADGGAGSDTLTLQGSYSAGLTFNAGALVEIETLHLLSRTDTFYGGSSLSPFSYNLTTVDANVAAGALLTIDASGLAATEGLDFNGKAELDGRFAVTGGLAGDTLFGGAGADSLSGGGGSDRLDGGAGADTLGGGSGDDQIDGGAGADAMTGGSGNDLYIVDNGGDVALESPGAGTDEIRTALASYTVAPNIEVLRGTSAAGQQLTGGSAGLAIFGAAGSDLLDDGGAAAAMQGGQGDDVYVVRAAGTTATETGGEGTDMVRSYTSTFSLFTGVEILVGMLSTGQTLIGHSGDDIITGGAGADRLDGAGGADVLTGGLGGDFYVVDTLADTVVEAAGEGIDTIETALAAFTLIANVENLTARTNSGQTLTGNDAANVITAGAGNDVLVGLGGNDRLIGGGGSDTITYAGSAVGIVATVGPFYSGTVTVGAGETDSFDGIEIVVGTDFADTFVNNSTVPASVMRFTGGAGDDVYRVGSTADVIVELAGGGTDHVLTSAFSYSLGANLENLTGTSTESQNLFGNALDNFVTGGSAANTLRLEAGGADRADGGEGNDTIVFGASFGAGDSVEGGSGTDVLRLQGSYASLSLGANVSGIETLELYGGAAASPNGYQIASLGLAAPAGAFKVDGTRLQAGNTLSFDASAETDIGFTLLGGAGDDMLKGGAEDDHLAGSDGNDALFGGGGDDVIEGGGGDDRALFHAAGAGAATIDMGAGNDRVVIEHLDGGSVRVTLGTGQDVLAVERVPVEQAGQSLGALVVGDFDTGASGDRFEWPADLAAALTGWTAGANPFATGHARLVQSGAHTLLQVSRSANGVFATLATFENRAAADFTGDNFGGWSPLPVTGGSDADQLAGTASSDHLFGGGGNDVFHLGAGGDDLADGGTGNDVFYFGAALSPGDVARGGDGRDAIVLQGNVTVALSDTNLVGIEFDLASERRQCDLRRHGEQFLRFRRDDGGRQRRGGAAADRQRPVAPGRRGLHLRRLGGDRRPVPRLRRPWGRRFGRRRRGRRLLLRGPALGRRRQGRRRRRARLAGDQRRQRSDPRRLRGGQLHQHRVDLAQQPLRHRSDPEAELRARPPQRQRRPGRDPDRQRKLDHGRRPVRRHRRQRGRGRQAHPARRRRKRRADRRRGQRHPLRRGRGGRPHWRGRGGHVPLRPGGGFPGGLARRDPRLPVGARQDRPQPDRRQHRERRQPGLQLDRLERLHQRRRPAPRLSVGRPVDRRGRHRRRRRRRPRHHRHRHRCDSADRRRLPALAASSPIRRFRCRKPGPVRRFALWKLPFGGNCASAEDGGMV